MQRLLCVVAVALFSSLIVCPSSFGQGSLTPPGPPGPTMKTLQQVEPRTPVTNLPFNISQPGSYYLTTNLTGTSGFDGIIIVSGNVTLDLAGFALLGVPGSLHGIIISGARTNVTVRNGSVSSWGSDGVVAGDPAARNLVFDRLNVSASGGYGIFANTGLMIGCNVNVSGSDGIHAFACEVRNCSVASSAGTGISATSSTVRDCSVTASAGIGITASDSTVRDCAVGFSGSTGIFVVPGTVTGCLVQFSGQSGIYVNLPGSQVTGNTCKGNNTGNSASYAGIYVNDSNNRIENNFLHGNGASGSGILVNGVYSGNIIIKNSVSGNGTNNYVVPGAQVVGPLITTTGIITNSNPWANFSF